MKEVISDIQKLVDATAGSLSKSFGNYWPTKDAYDPPEQNVSIHFSHAMLSAGFSVFAEVRHPHPHRGKVERIDLLGLSPKSDWFLGCEFKRLFFKTDVKSMITDLKRLSTFQVEKKMLKAKSKCRQGFGLVAGLHWIDYPNESSEILDVWNDQSKSGGYSNLAKQFEKRDANLFPPTKVINYRKEGRYYLLAAMFPIPGE